MTKIKKLAAIALAFLMVFASVSILASAWDAKVNDGFDLNITSKIFRQVNGEWQETEKVRRGEAVKARVYMTTSYYVGSGDLLFFYNNDFFEDSYTSSASALTVNTDTYPATGLVYGSTTAAQDMFDAGKISKEFLDSHNSLTVVYTFNSGSKNQRFKKTQWFCEFDLTVKQDVAEGSTGSLFAVEETARTEDFTFGKISVSKVERDKTVGEAVDMANWTANLTFVKNPVSLYENYVSVIFNANGGKIDDNSTTYETGNDAGEALTAPTPTKPNSKFLGWAVKGTSETVSISKFPAQDTEYVAVWKDSISGDEEVSFKTEIFRQDETTGEWIYTERVKPGEKVKARLYIDTNYYTNSGGVMLFYDNDFFTDDIEYRTQNTLTLNTDADSSAAKTGSTGMWAKLRYSFSTPLQTMVEKGYITKEFVDTHTVYAVNYIFNPAKGTKLSGDKWFAEFDLTVKEDATGSGNFFMVENTVQNLERQFAYCNIPLSSDGGADIDNVGMTQFTAKINVDDTHSVSTYSTITFDANGGTFEGGKTSFVYPTDANIIANIGETVDTSLVPTVSKPGSSFVGWVDASVAEPTEADVIEMPITLGYTDITLKAYWKGNAKITFVDAAGSTDITVVGGSEFEEVTPADKEGHAFVGWTTDSTYNKITGLPDVYPNADTTYYAVYTTLCYEVRYYVSLQGKNGFEYVDSISAEYGSKVSATPPSYDVPEGYTMSVAYTNPTLTMLFTEGTTVPVGGLKLYYAVYPNTYDVVFDANGGRFANGFETQTIPTKFADRIVVPAAPTYEGYEFTGWSPDVSTILDKAGTVTYVATWTPKTYDAIFYSEGEVHETMPTEFGAAIDEPAEPEREGYSFAGWSPALPDTMPAKDMIFNAKWTKNSYSVSFDAGEGKFDDGTNVVTKDVPYGDTITAPAEVPDRDGYTFLGWAKATTPDTVITDYGKVGAEGKSFVAVWSSSKHTVTFYSYDVDEHTDITSDTFKYAYETKEDVAEGTVVEFPAENPEIEYFVFKGWVDKDGKPVEAGLTMPNEDLNIYAKFERVAVKLVPKTGSTTIVERDGAIEKLADNSVTPDRVEPATAGNYNNWFVYGLKERITKSELEASYIDVLGDGRIVVTPIKPGNSGATGTGTLIQVYDNVTDELVETFHIVIFGDLDGDALIDSSDISILSGENLGETKWSADEAYAYRFKAANIKKDSFLNQLDVRFIYDHSLSSGIINQETGLIEYTD